MLRCQLHRCRQLAAGQLAGDLQPPQRQQLPVVLVQPAGGLRDLLPLSLQVQPQDGEVDEVRPGVGPVPFLVQHGQGGAAPVPGAVAHLAHGYRHQPGAEAVRVAEAVQAVDGAQHGLLHDIVHVQVAVERPADDVVDQRQIRGHQLVQRRRLTGLRSRDQFAPLPYLHAHSALRTVVGLRPPFRRRTTPGPITLIGHPGNPVAGQGGRLLH